MDEVLQDDEQRPRRIGDGFHAAAAAERSSSYVASLRLQPACQLDLSA
jgi:hypothetical protein